MWRKLKWVLKLLGILISIAFIVLIVLFYRFSTPKTDEKINHEFDNSGIDVFISHKSYNDFKVRLLTTQKEIDTLLPTIVFIHGSIGSALDFKNYMTDKKLNDAANLVSYDRIGYGIHQTGDVQESILFEAQMLEQILKEINPNNTVLVGYSYGGPIALALENKVKSIVLLAPAVYSKVEPMPWALNFYKWKATRWMLPKIWKGASREKLSHKADLQKFEQNWQQCKSEIISVHGNEDWIVPFENSKFLKGIFSPYQFELIALENAGHSLVWSNFKEIRNILIEQLN